MSRTPRLRRAALAAPASVLALLLSLPAVADAREADPDDYPTWEEVEAARSSEAEAEAAYERLEEALQRAEGEASEAATAAIEADLASQAAQRSLAEASDRERRIGVRLEAAEKELDENSDVLGRTVSWLYRDGTGLARYSELASAEDSEEFMAKLSVATQVTSTWNTLADDAAAQVNAAASLREQAEAARTERERLADEADSAAEAASLASAEAETVAAAASERTDTVYAQLASLRGTTAETERRHQLGIQVAAQARQREQERRQEEERARERAGGSEGSGGGTGGSGGGSGGSGGGSGGSGGGSGGSGRSGGSGDNSPAAAQAYARRAIGAYGWGGGEFTCLVKLWDGESGWRYDATNPWSGAYGIPQSWPAEKMGAAGPDWRTNAATQVDWGLAYIDAAYGTPCNAYSTWLGRDPHWY